MLLYLLLYLVWWLLSSFYYFLGSTKGIAFGTILKTTLLIKDGELQDISAFSVILDKDDKVTSNQCHSVGQ